MEENKPKKYWGRGRRKPKELANRTKRFEIRLTNGEWNQLYNEAEQNGHSPTHYARLRLFRNSEASVINAVEYLKALQEKNRELNAIGKNINQIARYANYLQNSGQYQLAVIEELNKILGELVRTQRESADLSKKVLKA